MPKCVVTSAPQTYENLIRRLRMEVASNNCQNMAALQNALFELLQSRKTKYIICNTHYVNHKLRGLPKPVFTVKCCDLSLVIGQDNDLYCNLSTYFHGT